MKYRILIGFIVIPFLGFSLYSCGAVAVGSAGAGGYKTAVDERSIGTIYDDTVISGKVKTKLLSDEFVKSRYIDVDVLNGVVYLTGLVESASQRRMAADLARGVDGVRKIENQLVVGKTSVGTIVDDTILTSKIKAELIKADNVRSTNIDVDTVNGVVTLTGIVRSEQEKNTVLYITQQVAGNRKIIDNISVNP